MRETWDKLGIPEAEKKYLAGVGAQYESEVVYHNLQEDLAKQGRDLPGHGLRRCASTRTSSASYFGTIIPSNDNKFAALNSAVWSGGSFIYVPPRASRSSCRCRPTSGSTPRTWASSSGR